MFKEFLETIAGFGEWVLFVVMSLFVVYQLFLFAKAVWRMPK